MILSFRYHFNSYHFNSESSESRLVHTNTLPVDYRYRSSHSLFSSRSFDAKVIKQRCREVRQADSRVPFLCDVSGPLADVNL